MSPNKNETYQLELPGGVVMDFVYVPSGEFLMGERDYVTLDESPQHKVYLDEYWIGKYPVTNEQYRAYVDYGDGKEPFNFQMSIRMKALGMNFDHYNEPKRRYHPVMGVCWHESVAFCDWLSQFSGEKIRLPTEAQWEKAARGTDGRKYPWGNRKPTSKRANYYNRNIVDTTPVGSYPKGTSPYGALDMTGNVWEWVADWYARDYYSRSPSENPSGPKNGKYRIYRGGSFNENEKVLRVSSRSWGVPDYTEYFSGFRCLHRAAP